MSSPGARIRQVTYFTRAGAANSPACIDAVSALVAEGCRHVVVASTWGDTALALAQRLGQDGADLAGGVNLVCVTHSAGFKKPGQQECPADVVERLRSMGVKVYSGTILTHSLETSFESEFGGVYPTTIIAHTLRRLGQGMKVAVEVVMEACDAGLIPEEAEVVAVGGTGRGADTVAIIRSAASKRFLKLAVLEIVAMVRG